MTKKGGIQQLQAELNSDEDLEKFLERNGLLVIDIYSEWCGPCLGMVSSLRKIKLEIGGDNLHLAVAKSDYITPFHRFQRKSEPTWMFVVNGKSTNIAFGTDVPALTKIILNELNLIHETDRVFYEIGELQPEELQMKRILEDAKAKADAIEEEQRLKKRHEYLTHVTDIILDNLKDAAVTIFGPQVNREMFKKINEPADSLKIQCKDRRMINITPENFEIINFDCPNPIHPDIEKQFYEKEVMICFWKLPENGDHTLLFQYELELSKSSEQTDEVTGEVITTPPILTPLEIQIQVEVDEDEADELQEKIPSPNEFESEEHEDINGAEEIPNNQQDLLDISNFENVTEETTDKDTQLHIEQPSELTESLPAETQKLKKKVSVMKTIKIPPVWVPANQRTHAALIYVLFRNQTTGFLPPDPIPEPPHVIMAFDSYKKRDIIPFTEKHKESVPLYGFFTSDIIAETKLIANSLEKYSVAQKNSSDKLLLKVHKTDTDVMLSLAAYNPSYVSPNTVIGAEDSLKIFPASYKTGSQEQLEKVGNGNGDEKKKKKKGKRGTASKATVEAIQTETTPEETPRGESADDSGDSRPQTSDIGEEAYVENGSDGSDIGDAADNENTPKEVAI